MLRTFLIAIFSTGAAFAGAPVIGIATASGHFSVQSSDVWGNSTLFDGSTIETAKASSELALRNGVKVQLGAESKARVWEHRVLLERGVGQVAAPSVYEIDAAGLKIKADGARVRVGITDRIEVVSFAGSARVTTQAGLLLASIPAGRAMSFAMQAGSSGIVSRTGCLLYKDGHFILQDENTQEVAQLEGSINLASNTGNRVTVTGAASGSKPAVSIATVVLNVATIRQESQGGCLSVASVLEARTEAPASAASPAPAPANAPAAPAPSSGGGGGGLSTGAKAAIFIGIAGGAGAAAAIALAGHKSSTSP
ncbi:MAG TPA: hypothetical protein VMB85_02650 [Bryobacteraceae bacterium]|nr:hypothetical protein [Bryobacteraceae bacterium]